MSTMVLVDFFFIIVLKLSKHVFTLSFVLSCGCVILIILLVLTGLMNMTFLSSYANYLENFSRYGITNFLDWSPFEAWQWTLGFRGEMLGSLGWLFKCNKDVELWLFSSQCHVACQLSNINLYKLFGKWLPKSWMDTSATWLPSWLILLNGSNGIELDSSQGSQVVANC